MWQLTHWQQLGWFTFFKKNFVVAGENERERTERGEERRSLEARIVGEKDVGE